jgi:DNA-binding transcriptional LysR family regulator
MESLRGMVSFVQTAREGSFVRAALALGISAVAVSRNVGRLEAQLGVRLFARTTRALSLTEEGAALLAQCEAPLEQLGSAFARSREAAGAPSGRVRVTAVSPFARTYLMPHLGEFHRRYPLVELDIELSEQVTDLVADRFDVGIRVGPLRDASFVARPLGPLQLVLCASPAYLKAAPALASVNDLSQHPGLALMLTGSSKALPWWLTNIKGSKGFVEMPVVGPLRCNDFLALTEACCAGLGLAQLPLVAALPALRAGRLKVVLPTAAPQGLQLFMHYPDRQLPARVRVFVEFVAALMQRHPDLDISPTQFVDGAAKPHAPSATKPTAAKPARRARAAVTKPRTAMAPVPAARAARAGRRK